MSLRVAGRQQVASSVVTCGPTITLATSDGTQWCSFFAFISVALGVWYRNNSGGTSQLFGTSYIVILRERRKTGLFSTHQRIGAEGLNNKDVEGCCVFHAPIANMCGSDYIRKRCLYKYLLGICYGEIDSKRPKMARILKLSPVLYYILRKIFLVDRRNVIHLISRRLLSICLSLYLTTTVVQWSQCGRSTA